MRWTAGEVMDKHSSKHPDGEISTPSEYNISTFWEVSLPLN